MSRLALFTAPFGGGRQDFQLSIGELEELQEKCDAGPEEIWHRVSDGKWRVADIRETLRLGLKGAGMDPTKALIMVERYAGAGQLAPLKPLVLGVIGAAILGAPDEDAPPPDGDDGSGEARAGAEPTSPAGS